MKQHGLLATPYASIAVAAIALLIVTFALRPEVRAEPEAIGRAPPHLQNHRRLLMKCTFFRWAPACWSVLFTAS